MKIFIAGAMLLFAAASWFLYHQTTSMPQPHCDIDSKAYLERGTLFYNTNKFVTAHHPQQPYYALGYALFIGLAYKIFGQSLGVIILLQLLVALISCLLMMRMAQRLFGLRARCWVPVLFACNLGYLVFVQFVLTEIVLSFFLLLFFERLTAYFHRQQLPVLAQAGLALGCSMIIKPAAMYFVFVVCAMLALGLVGACKLRLLRSVLFALCFYLPVIGYMTYNYQAFGNFALCTLDKINLYYWFFPNVLAYEHGTTSDAERKQLLAHQSDEVVGKLFWQKVVHKPLLVGYVWLLNVMKTCAGLYATNLKVLVEPQVFGGAISYFKIPGGWCAKAWGYITAGATRPWVVAVTLFEVFYSLMRYILCAVALWFLFRKKQWLALATIVIFIAYFALITGHDGCARFRMMFEFLLIVLAAGGLGSINVIKCER